MHTHGQIITKKHGREKHALQRKVKTLRDVLQVALQFCPADVKKAAAPLLRGARAPQKEIPLPEAEAFSAEHPDIGAWSSAVHEELANKGFFGRIAWAIGYIFMGIGGAK